jgi:flavin reductase (DIM6/NTAB) family NADH-FMN oxidoreductase RutF
MSSRPGETDFDPALDPLAFRRALGRFATGVTVVTLAGPEGPLGITANSFAALSLDPPLVLWSPAKRSGRHALFTASAEFAIHILSAGQQALCDHFVRSADGFDAFPYRLSPEGVPILSGCAAVFECRLEAIHDGGDHTIVVGRVRRACSRPGATLIFSHGQFGIAEDTGQGPAKAIERGA